MGEPKTAVWFAPSLHTYTLTEGWAGDRRAERPGVEIDQTACRGAVAWPDLDALRPWLLGGSLPEGSEVQDG